MLKVMKSQKMISQSSNNNKPTIISDFLQVNRNNKGVKIRRGTRHNDKSRMIMAQSERTLSTY